MQSGDAGLAAAAALINAASLPMAVFDSAGACLAANRAYVLGAAADPSAASGEKERRVPFSPDGRRTWVLATKDAAATAGPGLALVDAVVNALPIMFNAKDQNSRYLFMNRYQAELYGVTPAAAVGRTARELLGDTYGAYTRSIDAEVIRTGRAVPFFEECYAGVDEVPRHWLTSKVPLLGDDGAAWGVATVAIDITERKRLEQSLRTARDEAEAGSRAKSRFLAGMSHELRTPLNAVIGFAELMEQEALGPLGHPEYREYAGHVLRSGTHLLGMINNLLDFARLESGALRLSLAPVELARLARSVLAGIGAERVAAGGPAPQLTLEAPDAPVAIVGDEARLRQVLGGLVQNALKFSTPGGAVRITLHGPSQGHAARIAVSDQGIGMSAQELEHVFEPFWQADGGLRRQHDGAGIGLRLARDLIELHGGTLSLDSRKGQGTTVTITLPPEPPAPAALASEPSAG